MKYAYEFVVYYENRLKFVDYDGKTITYDVFGCPTDYMGSAMT